MAQNIVLRDDGNSGLQVSDEVPETAESLVTSLLVILRTISAILYDLTWTMELVQDDARRPGRYRANLSLLYRWREDGHRVTTVIPPIRTRSGPRTIANAISGALIESFGLLVHPENQPGRGILLDEILTVIAYLDLCRVVSPNFSPTLQFRPYLRKFYETDFLEEAGQDEDEIGSGLWDPIEGRALEIITSRMELNLHGVGLNEVIDDGDAIPGDSDDTAKSFAENALKEALNVAIDSEGN